MCNQVVYLLKQPRGLRIDRLCASRRAVAACITDPEGSGAANECVCGGHISIPSSSTNPQQLLHSTQEVALQLAGDRPGHVVQVTLHGSDLVNRLQIGRHAEVVVRSTPDNLQKHGPIAVATHSMEVLNAFHVTPFSIRASKLQLHMHAIDCEAMRQLQPEPLQYLMDQLRVATGVKQQTVISWYLLMAVLLSAAAAGQELRGSKVAGHKEHRCQLHLLLLGDAIPPVIHDFLKTAAHILSPDVVSLTLTQPLHSSMSSDANGTVTVHAGGLASGAQGVALLSIAAATAAQRSQVCECIFNSRPVPKGSTTTSCMNLTANTTTCWLTYDSQAAPKQLDTALDSVRLTYGAPFLSTIDLVVPAGDDVMDHEGLADMRFGLSQSEDSSDVTAADAATAVQTYMLHAASMDPPTMCAACVLLLPLCESCIWYHHVCMLTPLAHTRRRAGAPKQCRSFNHTTQPCAQHMPQHAQPTPRRQRSALCCA